MTTMRVAFSIIILLAVVVLSFIAGIALTLKDLTIEQED